MKKAVAFLSALIIALSFTSCKKEKDSTTTQPTPKTIAGVYRISGLKAQAGSNPQVDVYNQLTECQKQDTWGFQENGTFLFGGAATQSCQDGDFSGTWKLNGKTFTITSQASDDDYQLVNFDGKVLVLSISGTLNNADATYYVSFTKFM
ncbi:lipocalin family protein [Flavisolibacter ginsenosidimutans]|uniref:Lipocalin-like domain-containing protein n=1 Tax=Flavisolibacter ginsenosidimutans TaxID=661481 RepID=A0A5B8UE70_9BACT|nr:lipocalin family protein [Flavisolibacter ginsenosidimutans]QEC54645.1 hypothetical protein FSB75_01595 [Flavisolibacter ginsenosidimutans]